MTSEQFVEQYNKTADACYFGHRIQLNKEIPRKILHRNWHRVAAGDSISFMLTESGGQVRDISMMDSQALVPGHRQLQSIAASIMMDVLMGLPKAERKAIISKLGLPTGKYAADVAIGQKYIATIRMVSKPPRHTLILEVRYIRGKGVKVVAN